MSMMCDASSAPLSTELAVIDRRSGSGHVTTLKLPLVPRTQPRAWNRRPTAASDSAACSGVREGTLGIRAKLGAGCSCWLLADAGGRIRGRVLVHERLDLGRHGTVHLGRC